MQPKTITLTESALKQFKVPFLHFIQQPMHKLESPVKLFCANQHWFCQKKIPVTFSEI